MIFIQITYDDANQMQNVSNISFSPSIDCCKEVLKEKSVG